MLSLTTLTLNRRNTAKTKKGSEWSKAASAFSSHILKLLRAYLKCCYSLPFHLGAALQRFKMHQKLLVHQTSKKLLHFTVVSHSYLSSSSFELCFWQDKIGLPKKSFTSPSIIASTSFRFQRLSPPIITGRR